MYLWAVESLGSKKKVFEEGGSRRAELSKGGYVSATSKLQLQFVDVEVVQINNKFYTTAITIKYVRSSQSIHLSS
jgi:hypothetical protein